MNDIDLDRLGDVWRARPDPGEIEALQRTAAEVSRRARWAQLVDTFGAVIVAVAVIVLVLRSPEIDTMLVGGGAILVLLASQARQRRLRAEELRSLTGDTEAMLDQSIARLEATQKRARFSLLGLSGGIPLGILLVTAVERRGGHGMVAELLEGPNLSPVLWALGASILIGVAIHFALTIRRARREAERLAAMRDDYRREHESSLPE